MSIGESLKKFLRRASKATDEALKEGMDSAETDPSLKDLIAYSRNQLDLAIEERKARNDEGWLDVKSLTLEVNVVATSAAEGGLGLDLKIVKADGKRSYEQQQVHKITLLLEPRPTSNKAATAETITGQRKSMIADSFGSHDRTLKVEFPGS